MKCLVLIVALCCIGVCNGQSASMGLDFLLQNLLNPMLNNIATNAIGLLGQHLNDGIANLFGSIGKRDLTDVFNINIAQVLAPFIAQVKQVYERVFKVFLQIVQHVEDWVEKPDWARIELVRAGDFAEQAVERMTLSADFLQPLVNLVQQHLHAMITGLQGVVAQVLDAAKHPVQTLIGSLKP